jgi:hypothetical protein
MEADHEAVESGGKGKKNRTAPGKRPLDAYLERQARGGVKAKPDDERSYVYIGAALPKVGLASNFIIKGTRAEAEAVLAEAVGKYPLVKNLLVPVSRLAESRAKVQGTDNLLGRYYAELKQDVQGKEA